MRGGAESLAAGNGGGGSGHGGESPPLHEAMVLLALRPDTGSPRKGAPLLPYAVTAAVLAELVLCGRLELIERGRHRLVQVVDSAQTGDPVLDRVLERIRAHGRPRAAWAWLLLIPGGELWRAAAEGLRRRGVLRTGKRRASGLFLLPTFPARDSLAAERLLDDVRAATLPAGEDLAPRAAILVGLAWEVGLLPGVLGARAVKDRRARLRALASAQPLAGELRRAVRIVGVAVAAAMGAGAVIAGLL